MKRLLPGVVLVLTASLVLTLGLIPARAQAPVVHALLFYSRTCPHCQKVVSEDLPPLMEKYGDQLVILGVDTYTEQGYQLYEAAIQHFEIPPERRGVPTLIVGDTVLVGSGEIPELFPGIVAAGLESGGIDWPDFPEFKALLESEDLLDAAGPEEAAGPPEGTPSGTAESPPKAGSPGQEEPTPEGERVSETETPTPTTSAGMEADGGSSPESDPAGPENEAPEAGRGEATPQDPISPTPIPALSTSLGGAVVDARPPTLSEQFGRDPVGNTVSVFVLAGMLFSLAGVGLVMRPAVEIKPWPAWAVPLLVVAGTGVALYLSYVEVTGTQAVCGPVGDCNTVQQSPYATLFGVIHVGVLGVAGYLAIAATWLVAIWGPEKWRGRSIWAAWAFSLFGAAFSIYLTFLEPFVIGATCAWCLTSAVIMHLLLWATTAQRKAWA